MDAVVGLDPIFAGYGGAVNSFRGLLASGLAVAVMAWGDRALADDFVEPRGALTLAQAVAAVRVRNPDLMRGELEVRAAAARAVQAGTRPNPELDMAFENFAGSGSARGTSVLESTLTLSQVVELGGRRSKRSAAAQAGRSVALVERRIQELDVLSEVVRRFIDVVARQESVGLAERAEKLAADTALSIARRVQAARSPRSEQSRATIESTRAHLDARRAEYNLGAARAALAALWGSASPEFERAQADLYVVPAVPAIEELTRRLETNPDVQRLGAQTRLREAEMRLQEAQRLPNVTFGAGVRQFRETQDSAVVASVSVPLPLFDRNQGNIQEAEVRREQAVVEGRQTVIEARLMLLKLYQEVQTAQLEAAALRETIVPQAEQALSQIEYGYERGRFSYLELLSAQRDVIDSQRARIESAANIHRLISEMERLTGASLSESPE